MVKTFFKMLLVLSLVFGLTGCGREYPELENNAIGFKTNSYIDVNDDAAGYLTFEYDGRIYMPYGTSDGAVSEKNIDKCIGYIIQDENSSSVIDPNNKDERVYTLVDDKEHNFLMVYYTKDFLMNPRIFYRAIDTKGKDIVIPEYIESSNSKYWR